MKLRDELDQHRHAVDGCQVAVKTRAGGIKRSQQQTRDAFEGR